MGTYSEPLKPFNVSDLVTESRSEARQPGKSHLSVIRGSGGEESLKRVVAGEEETGKVDEELASDVEENQEEVHSSQTQDHVDLGNGGLSLKVVEHRVLGQLSQNVSPNERWEIASARSNAGMTVRIAGALVAVLIRRVCSNATSETKRR